MKKRTTSKKRARTARSKKPTLAQALMETLPTEAAVKTDLPEEQKKDRYVVLSLSMIEIKKRDVPVFQLKDRQENLLVIKTALEIICTPSIAFELSKPDLLQVSYFAGNMMVH